MAKTESVLFKLGADVSGLTSGLAKGRAGMKDLEKGADGLATKLLGLAGVLGVGLGFASAAREALEFADAVTKVSGSTGMSTDAVQRLAFFATQTGTTLDAVAGAVSKMQISLVKAADGTEKQAEAFASLGINTETFFRLDPEAQLMAVARGLEGIANPADKAAVAQIALGKSYAETLPLMHDMATKGEELAATFDKMGGPMTADAIKALDGIGDAASVTGQSVRNFAGEILYLASPAIIGALEGITTFFASLRHSLSGGNNELAMVTGQIDEMAKRLEYMSRTNPFPDAFMQNQIDKTQMELDLLRKREQLLIDTPYKEAMAKLAAAKIAPDPAQELEDIIVHAEERRKVVLAADLLEMQERYAQQQEWEAIIQADILDHQEAISGIEAAEMDARAQFSTMSLSQQAATVTGKLVAMTEATAQHSKTMFAINKAASLANATVAGYESVMSSYKFGANIGGPYVGAAFAAVAAVAAAANISAIAKTSFNGGGAGLAPSNATQSPVPTTPAGGQGGGGGANAGGVMRVEGISPDSILTGRMVKNMAEKLNDFVRDGGRVEWAQ